MKTTSDRVIPIMSELTKSLSHEELRNIHVILKQLDDEVAEEEISHFAEIYWIPSHFKHNRLFDDEEPREYHLSFLQRVFLTLEYPSSSIIAEYIALVNNSAILLNLIVVLLSSERSLHYFPSSCSNPVCDHDINLCPDKIICPPSYDRVFQPIDFACVVIFSIDFIIRLSLCSIMPTRLSGTIPWYWDDFEKERAEHEQRLPLIEPFYPSYMIFIRYIISFHGIIDIVSIIPTYVYILSSSSASSPSSTSISSSVLRVLRLLRVIRTIKINTRGRMVVDLLYRTAHASREAMFILSFYLMLIIIFFASVIYAIESGEYTINSSYPTGSYLRYDGYDGLSESPYDSIPTSIYYMIVTMMSVGYGDIYPTSIAGRAIASICCILGLFMTALPISIISTSFTQEYDKYLVRRQKYDAYQRDKHDLARGLRDVPLTSRLKAAMNHIRHHHHDHKHSMDDLSDHHHRHHHDHDLSKHNLRDEILHQSKSIRAMHLNVDHHIMPSSSISSIPASSVRSSSLTSPSSTSSPSSSSIHKISSRHIYRRHSKMAVDLINAAIEAKINQINNHDISSSSIAALSTVEQHHSYDNDVVRHHDDDIIKMRQSIGIELLPITSPPPTSSSSLKKLFPSIKDDDDKKYMIVDDDDDSQHCLKPSLFNLKPEHSQPVTLPSSSISSSSSPSPPSSSSTSPPPSSSTSSSPPPPSSSSSIPSSSFSSSMIIADASGKFDHRHISSPPHHDSMISPAKPHNIDSTLSSSSSSLSSPPPRSSSSPPPSSSSEAAAKKQLCIKIADVTTKLGYDTICHHQTSSSSSSSSSPNMMITMADILNMSDAMISKLPKPLLALLFQEVQVAYHDLIQAHSDMISYADDMKRLSSAMMTRKNMMLTMDDIMNKNVLHTVHEHDDRQDHDDLHDEMVGT